MYSCRASYIELICTESILSYVNLPGNSIDIHFSKSFAWISQDQHVCFRCVEFTGQWRIQGRGPGGGGGGGGGGGWGTAPPPPPLLLYQTEAQRAEKNLPPPHPPFLSQGLDPALLCSRLLLGDRSNWPGVILFFHSR